MIKLLLNLNSILYKMMFLFSNIKKMWGVGLLTVNARFFDFFYFIFLLFFSLGMEG